MKWPKKMNVKVWKTTEGLVYVQPIEEEKMAVFIKHVESATGKEAELAVCLSGDDALGFEAKFVPKGKIDAFRRRAKVNINVPPVEVGKMYGHGAESKVG